MQRHKKPKSKSKSDGRWHKKPRARTFARFVGKTAKLDRIEKRITQLELIREDRNRQRQEAADRERYHQIRLQSLKTRI